MRSTKNKCNNTNDNKKNNNTHYQQNNHVQKYQTNNKKIILNNHSATHQQVNALNYPAIHLHNDSQQSFTKLN